LTLSALIILSSQALAAPVWPHVGELLHDLISPTKIMVCPDGSGPPLSEARANGAVVDATIQVKLVDNYGDPIYMFPPEDLWLQFEVGEGTALACFNNASYPGGIFNADAATDSDGWTRFSQPLQGGGWSDASVTIYVAGYPALDPDENPHSPLPLGIVSPDINGDLVVGLSDIAHFVNDLMYPGEASHRSDFNNDSVINLSDVALMAQGIGTSCE